jgi:hypothetical protein
MLVAHEGKVQDKHRFVEVDATTETCNLTKGGNDDDGKLFQGDKKHHLSVGGNLGYYIERFALIIVVQENSYW